MILVFEMTSKVNAKSINRKQQALKLRIEATLKQVLWAESRFSSPFAYLHVNAYNTQNQTSRS